MDVERPLGVSRVHLGAHGGEQAHRPGGQLQRRTAGWRWLDAEPADVPLKDCRPGGDVERRDAQLHPAGDDVQGMALDEDHLRVISRRDPVDGKHHIDGFDDAM